MFLHIASLLIISFIKNLNDILNTDNYLATRIRIENFNKNNLDWNKISQSKELKFDYAKLGRDKQPMAIY